MKMFTVLIISSVLISESICQSFHFPYGIKAKECGLESGTDYWTAIGTFETSLWDMGDFIPEVTIQIEDGLTVCGIDLTTCPPSPILSDGCYCTSHDTSTNVYGLSVNQLAWQPHSETIVQAKYVSSNFVTTVGSVGQLPPIYEQTTLTYSLDGGPAIPFNADITEDVGSKESVQLQFCASNLGVGYTLTIDGQSAIDGCVTKRFTKPYSPVVFSYNETTGCNRNGTYTVILSSDEPESDSNTGGIVGGIIGMLGGIVGILGGIIGTFGGVIGVY